MKTIVILGDGMSDHPVAKLGGKTPLQVAKKPHIDRIAKEGRSGLFTTVPAGLSNGSAVANLSVLGYDPKVCYNGRAVLEAANMNVEIRNGDVGVRCNLVSFSGANIKNHSAGHISNVEAHQIITDLEAALGGGKGHQPVRFYPGVSYRHLLVLEGGWADPAVSCAPPHDHVGESVASLMPTAKNNSPAATATAARFRELIEKSQAILANHPVNLARRAAGKDTADSIWLWSPGRRPTMETFQERFGKTGAVISAVDLIMGLGVYAGMDVIHVEGATGLWDTNYEGKAQAALDSLKDHDFVYVHVEATDEAGHARDLDMKIKCIEMLDDRLVRPILEGIKARGIEATVAVLPDHPTPVETGLHANDPVPVAIWNPRLSADATQVYDETEAAKGSLGLIEGDQFIRLALGMTI